MRLKPFSWISLRARSTRGHAVAARGSWTFGGPQYTKILPSAGSTITKCLGSLGRGLCHGPLEIFVPSSRPTVCLDVISLVASSCGYDSGQIEQRVAR